MRMIAFLLVPGCFAVAACRPDLRPGLDMASRPVEVTSLPTPPPTVMPKVETLAGEWRVAAIDGRTLDEPIGLALTGDRTQLWWQPRCAGMARNYRIALTQIRFEGAGPPRPAGSPTPPVCAIGLPPRLADLFRALDDATSIVRLPNNGILLSGGAHSVTLFAQ